MSDRIRFGEPIELTLPPEKLPSVSLLVQQAATKRDSSFQVYIVKEAYDKAWRHVDTSRHAECGGILVGHPFRTYDRDITFIVIVDAISQDSDNRSIGHFTVSPAEIADARVILEQKGYFAVGWYHSHPGHGVFLSGQDMTIVRSIYNSHWHVAWVIDPQHQEEAFFYGPTGKRLAEQFLLHEEPDFVKASAMCKRGQDALENGGMNIGRARNIFKQLERALDSNRDLAARWQETGRYQDILNVLERLSADNTEPSSEDTPDTSLDQQAIAASEHDLMQISQRYDQARKLLDEAIEISLEHSPKSDEIRQAYQILEWLKKKSPGYRRVDQLTDRSKDILDILDSAPIPPRRLALSDERKLRRRLEELRSLLQSD